MFRVNTTLDSLKNTHLFDIVSPELLSELHLTLSQHIRKCCQALHQEPQNDNRDLCLTVSHIPDTVLVNTKWLHKASPLHIIHTLQGSPWAIPQL